MGIRSIAADLGWEVRVRCWVDSSAAKAMASRSGLGKTRHIEVRYLWVQEVARRKYVQIRKIAGTSNISDILTKPLGRCDMTKHLSRTHVA